MYSAMLLTFSIIALSQFALYYWRAVLAGVAAQPVSDRVLAAARVDNRRLTAGDFPMLSGLHDLTPALLPGPSNLTAVRLYHNAMERLGKIAGARIPAIATWSERERMVCARFAAVQIDRRLQANLALAAALRSS